MNFVPTKDGEMKRKVCVCLFLLQQGRRHKVKCILCSGRKHTYSIISASGSRPDGLNHWQMLNYRRRLDRALESQVS